jgi:uncharacterized protein (TIGR02996 family)
MPSVMAVVSKKVFAQQAGKAGPGELLPLERYESAHKGLSPLSDGGSLFCVTARPDDQLWLVAVLEGPSFKKDGWQSPANSVPITDITHLIGELRFANGKGLTAKPGKLGMSLQTPRTLAAEDVALLRGAAGAETPKKKAPAKKNKEQEAKKVTPKQAEPKKAARKAIPAPLAAGNPDLARAMESLRAGCRASALAALLDAWGRERQPEIAALVETLGADIDRSLPPVEGKRTELADNWLELARHSRPVDVGRLLAALTDGASTAQMRQMIPSLLAFRPDPRMSGPMVTLVGRYTSSGATPALTQALNLLAHVMDPRVKKELSKFKQTARSWLEGVYRKAQKVAGALAEAPPLSADDREAVTAIEATLAELAAGPPAEAGALLAPPRAGDDVGAKLLAAVFERPDDDESRLVYADWLLERGDPRGELIQLQYKKLEGELRGDDAKRERALLKSHAADWVGPLVLVAKDLRFARGFLDGCSVLIKTDRQRAVIGDPHWATVRELTFAAESYDSVAEEPALLRDPGLRALEVLENASARTLVEWLHEKPATAGRLRELRGMRVSDAANDDFKDYGWSPEHELYQRSDLSHWRELCALAPRTLTRLALSPCIMGANWGVVTGYGWLHESPLGARLEELTLDTDEYYPPVARLSDVFKRLPALKRLQLHAAGGWGYNLANAEFLATADRQDRSYSLRITLTRPFHSWDSDEDNIRGWVRAVLMGVFEDFPRREIPELELALHRKPTKSDLKKLREEVAPLCKGKFKRVVLPDGSEAA